MGITALEPRSKRQIRAKSFDTARLPSRIVRQRLPEPSPLAKRARKKFLRFFSDGFFDETYLAWERGYKLEATRRWAEALNPNRFRELLSARSYPQIASEAVRIESRTNLLFSFEKMALRDAIKSRAGAERFATGLFDWLYGRGDRQERFDDWIAVIESLPRRQTRVLTWPVATVFGFIAEPDSGIFLKPMVTRRAAERYGFDFDYQSRPNWETYASLLNFAATIKRDIVDLAPRDMIDIQSFIWVQGSDEYE